MVFSGESAELNNHLQDNSYVAGWTPSKADAEVFATIKAAPDATKFVNIRRWWNNINSYPEAERKAWAVSTGAATAPGADNKKKDDDFDLFGEDEEDEEYEREVERRAKEAADKKIAAGKIKPIAKSIVIIDVKPWEDTTDLKLMEEGVRAIEIDGLEWKASKLAEIGYGIKKLQISCHIEDEKVSVDDIQEKIQELEDYVQSTDIVSFSKL